MVRLAKQAGTVVAADMELLRRCRDAVREAAPDADVILYGSRARDEADADSDYDLLVLTDTPADLALEDRIRAKLYPIELDTGTVITLIAYNRDDWDSARHRAMPFHQNVTRDGVLL